MGGVGGWVGQCPMGWLKYRPLLGPCLLACLLLRAYRKRGPLILTFAWAGAPSKSSSQVMVGGGSGGVIVAAIVAAVSGKPFPWSPRCPIPAFTEGIFLSPELQHGLSTEKPRGMVICCKVCQLNSLRMRLLHRTPRERPTWRAHVTYTHTCKLNLFAQKLFPVIILSASLF